MRINHLPTEINHLPRRVYGALYHFFPIFALGSGERGFQIDQAEKWMWVGALVAWLAVVWLIYWLAAWYHNNKPPK